MHLTRRIASLGENTPLNLPVPSPNGPAFGSRRSSFDTIYRPFFVGGIAIVLTLGAVWGAYLLVRIAAAGKFTAVGLHEVNAHGHAQIFGWVGLFVMGFAYQVFPRFHKTTLRFPALAGVSFVLMAGGVLARSILEPLADGLDVVGRLAVIATALEVVAITLFAFVILATWRGSGTPFTASDGYILAALFWFLVQGVYEAIYVFATFRAGPGELVPLVAAWQGALRDVQIHGFATLMILGVSQRVLPAAYGFPAISRRRGLLILVGLNLGVIGESVGLVLMRLDGRAWAGLWYSSVLLFLGCAVAFVWGLRLFGPAGFADRSLKFFRVAYAWLLISLVMLAALPVYQFALLPAIAPESPAARMGFSHAFYGATRHAITVGFVSLMIVGMASRVVPGFRGFDPSGLSKLWVPFVLLNVGCALRVLGQTATDWADWVFPLAGASGVLEVTGLAIWGTHLVRLMFGRPADEAFPSVTASDDVSEVLDRHPALLPVFVEFGLRALAVPELRRTALRGVSIQLACRFAGADEQALLAAVNARLSGRKQTPLTVV